MNMSAILIISCLSSLFTIGFMVSFFALFFKKKLEQKLDVEVQNIKTEFEKGLLSTGEELIPAFRKELAEAFGQEVEAFLPEFRREVSEGFHEAGKELLPEYRQEVQAAFEAALVHVFSGKLVEKTALSVAKKGSNLVGTGLDLLFGNSSKKN